MRWNLYQLAQASARTQEQGIAAKGVTGAGYEGHYFWDTEIYVLPFLAYTSPDIARKLLRFRWAMLPIARQRAVDLNGAGAMYPWRTINGEEASAYYAAGTAQYHINAAIMFALKRYLDATGDIYFLADEGVEMLVETARMWEDLGFFAANGDRAFRIHGVTGPDEYTTVVNDNLYTNVMARFNLRYAARSVELLAEWNEQAYERLVRRVGLGDDETKRWNEAAQAMYIPYDERLGIHPQDDSFLDREPWDFEHTPPDRYPLLLHYHPLVIYRHQVLKQADVVLAMVLRGEHFSLEQKRRNFDYYDPITTGDSSLSACVQAVAAAQIGYDELAFDYFCEALYVDLADAHRNTADGVHIASAGGVWGALVFGFAGMYDNGVALRFAPSLAARLGRLLVPDRSSRQPDPRRRRHRRLPGHRDRRSARSPRRRRRDRARRCRREPSHPVPLVCRHARCPPPRRHGHHLRPEGPRPRLHLLRCSDPTIRCRRGSGGPVDAEVGVAGPADGRHDLGGVVAAAHLERAVHLRLAHVEVDALAQVGDLDQVGAGGGEHLEQPRQAAGAIVDRGEHDEPSTCFGLVAADQARHHSEIDVAARQDDARRALAGRSHDTVEQGGNADCAGTLDVQLGALHQQHHRVGDGILRDRHHVVEPPIDQRAGDRPGVLDGDAVGEGGDGARRGVSPPA